MVLRYRVLGPPAARRDRRGEEPAGQRVREQVLVQGDVVQDSGGPLVPLCDPVLPVSAAWVPEPLSP